MIRSAISCIPYEMWMKAFQLLCAFAGGSYAISDGLTGYAVAIVSVGLAIIGTLAWAAIAKLWGRAKQAYRGTFAN